MPEIAPDFIFEQKSQTRPEVRSEGATGGKTVGFTIVQDFKVFGNGPTRLAIIVLKGISD